MGYSEKNLVSGESLLYVARIHWIIFIVPILVLSVGAVFGRTIQGYIIDGAGLLVALYMFSEYIGSEFGVTDKRIIVKTGLIATTSREIFLNRIESIQLQQSIAGRLLGYGAVIPAGTGGDKADLHRYIDNPVELKKVIDQQIMGRG